MLFRSASSSRIFYATHSVTLDGSNLAGVQSVSMTANTNLEPVFQLGQLGQMELIENNPEVTITISRAIVDGCAYPLDISDADLNLLETTLMTPSTIAIGTAYGTGFTINECYISSYTANFSNDGVFTEDLEFIATSVTSGGAFNHRNDTKHAPRRQDFYGISGASSASVSCSFNREAQYRLGQFQPFERTVSFPIECSVQYGLLLPAGGTISAAGPSPCAAGSQGIVDFSIGACDAEWTIKKIGRAHV